MGLQEALPLTGRSQKEGGFPEKGLRLVWCPLVDRSTLAGRIGASQSELLGAHLFLEKEFFSFMYGEVVP